MAFNKNQFLNSYQGKLAELGRGQRNYRKIVTTTATNRMETIRGFKLAQQAQKYRNERDTLRSRLWTADSKPYKRENKLLLEEIRCNIECQDDFAEEIWQLKEDISKTQRVIQRLTKENVELGRQCRTERQQTAYVVRAGKKDEALRNEMQFFGRRECEYKSENDKLRGELMNLLNDRTFFNAAYSKMVRDLADEKKYLTDLIEFALGTFENTIHVYDKMNLLTKRDEIDKDKYDNDIERLTAFTVSDVTTQIHLGIKNKARSLADIDPKEYGRRDALRRKYKRKIDLYNKVMETILNFTKTHKIKNVIKKFQDHESQYYSYFNYANELSYHMTLMDHAVNQLFRDIPRLRTTNRGIVAEQLKEIEQLEDELKLHQKFNRHLAGKRAVQNSDQESLIHAIGDIFEAIHTDASPLVGMLGENRHVHLDNVQAVLKLIERRVLKIVAGVYISERLDLRRPIGNYTVEQVHKLNEWPTALEDIVLTHQCPECAEGDVFNVEDTGDARIHINTPKEAKKKLYERIVQPEMQYRLHNLSECKLPRSRILTAKRNMNL